jgi:hypothetical protein
MPLKLKTPRSIEVKLAPRVGLEPTTWQLISAHTIGMPLKLKTPRSIEVKLAPRVGLEPTT